MICPYFDFPECKVGKDICIGDEYNPELCDVYLEQKEEVREDEQKSNSD